MWEGGAYRFQEINSTPLPVTADEDDDVGNNAEKNTAEAEPEAQDEVETEGDAQDVEVELEEKESAPAETNQVQWEGELERRRKVREAEESERADIKDNTKAQEAGQEDMDISETNSGDHNRTINLVSDSDPERSVNTSGGVLNVSIPNNV